MKTSIPAFLFALAFVLVLAPASANEDDLSSVAAVRRLMNKVDSLRPNTSEGRMELKDIPQARRKMKHVDHPKSSGDTYATSAQDLDRNRELKKVKKNKRVKGKEPNGCCEFLSKLSELDAKCFEIVRKAEIIDISQDDLDCVGDLAPKSSDLSELADKYELAVFAYYYYLDAAADGDFDNVDGDCFAFTPTTFTFACDPDNTIMTDDAAFYTPSDADLSSVTSAPGTSKTPAPATRSPSTPAPATKAPVTPAPVTPAPVTPAPGP